METLKKLLIFRETEPFRPSSKKQKSSPRKQFLIFREMELSNSKVKKFLIFSQESPYFSGNGNPEKVLIFQEAELFYISGDGILSYFRKRNFLIIPETELSYTAGNGSFLYFGKGIFKTIACLELEAYSEP